MLINCFYLQTNLHWLPVNTTNPIYLSLEDLHLESPEDLKNTRFAVSAENNNNSLRATSSGMTWSTCQYPMLYSLDNLPPPPELSDSDQYVNFAIFYSKII